MSKPLIGVVVAVLVVVGGIFVLTSSQTEKEFTDLDDIATKESATSTPNPQSGAPRESVAVESKEPLQTSPSFAPPVVSQPKVKSQPMSPPTPKQTQEYADEAQQPRDSWRDPLPPAPVNLALPIIVEDVDTVHGLLSPYGIIRKSGDGGIGHGGIDFPLVPKSPIYAVANGTIIKNNVEDSGGGKTVDVLIVQGEFQGEGWIFKYDHLALEPGLAVGSNVQKGQKIGINAFEQRGNNHIGLEYHVENFTIARTKICWVELLEPTAKQQLEDEFNQIKYTQTFLESWQTASAEGYYQYKDLLDKTKYPDGPQLCYPLGTDARIPIH